MTTTLLLCCIALCQFLVTTSSFVIVALSSNQNSHQVRLLLSSNDYSKWDNLVDEDDEEDDSPPIPLDMEYVPRNMFRQHQTFCDIKEAGGVELTNDVYVNEPNTDIFWFVGKVARISDISVEQAVARQYPLIELHAAQLRPLELFPHRGNMEIWTAPGDSEMEVAYNRPNITMVKMAERTYHTPDIKKINHNFVGFTGEVYDGKEVGFRTWRNVETGKPNRPEVQGPDLNEYTDLENIDKRAPTDEEMREISAQLKGRDLNELYEEQERRKKKQE